jgi:tRNA nucleotidyltransferase (CCA-adding enzyme)
MQKNYQKVLKEVLKQVKPSNEDKKKLIGLAKKSLIVANREARKFNARAILAGSLVRDTWLPSKKEFEIFILFPTSLTREKLEKEGMKLGRQIVSKLNGRYVIKYAEHPYLCANVHGIDVDIVPCFNVKSTDQLKSAVDRTPFHVKYIEKNLSKRLSDEVRLLKQFLKANGIYGADTKTESFSGYSCELLIIKYRKFLNVLKQTSGWIPGDVIDIKKYYSPKDYSKLRKQFKDHVLILIDPTDRTRNTAAALSFYNFFKFKKLASEFLKKSTKEMFFERKIDPLTEAELIHLQMRRRTELILIKFKPPEVVPDILWPQLRRFADRLQSILEETEYEFKVLGKDIYTNERDLAVVLMEMEISKLPSIQKRIGPKIFDIDDSKRFLEKYKSQALAGPFVENGFWSVEVSRKFLTAREKLSDSLKDNASILKAKGIPNYIADQLAKEVEIFSESSRIFELIEKDKNFGMFLRKYFEKESLI